VRASVVPPEPPEHVDYNGSWPCRLGIEIILLSKSHLRFFFLPKKTTFHALC